MSAAVLSERQWHVGHPQQPNFRNLNDFYIYIVGFFVLFLIAIAILTKTGGRIMGTPDEKPEFSNFSWFSMMFGVGPMVFATTEPLGLWGSNPVVLFGEVGANTEAALQSAWR